MPEALATRVGADRRRTASDTTAAVPEGSVGSPADTGSSSVDVAFELPGAEAAAGEFAAALGRRRRTAGAPVRTVFVSTEGSPRADRRPPMAELLSGTTRGGGGRGGRLRVALYLSLLWVCGRRPYEVIRPARSWAALLGLEDPDVRGTRRIQATLRELQERGMVELRDRGGLPSVVTLLTDQGTGTAYETPSEVYRALSNRGATDQALLAHRYFRVPSTLWTSGTIAHLSGPGLSMLLVLRCEQRGKDDATVWFSPERFRTRFGLAESTQRDGLTELRELGLLRTSKRMVSESGNYIDFRRRRNVHLLNLGPLNPASPTHATPS